MTHLWAADDLDAALAAVDKRVDVPGHLAEILAQRRRLGIKGGKVQALVALQPCDGRQTPALAVQLAVIGFLEVRHADQAAVIAVGPTVIGTGKGGGVAGIRPTQPVAAVPADIEKRVDLAGTVAYHQNRVLAHIGREEIARLGDLALVAQEKPAAGKNPLLFLLVDLRLDKDAAAKEAVV